jgi:hypothetical protein
MADRQAREAAIASTEQACPRCGAPREPRQEYCLECGLRLPAAVGVLAAFRRRWILRFGWYPGDWVWTSMLTLLVAIAGAAVAIALAGGTTQGGSTFVASTSAFTSPTTHAATTTAALPTPPEPTVTRVTTTTPTTTRATTTTATTTAATTTTPTTPAAPNGATQWPKSQSGWTDVLVSYPVGGGRATPLAVAARAAHNGLPQVGVLDSGDYGSLHSGYYVVFSGIYDSQSAARSALAHVRAKGFGGAYSRQISG